MNLGQIQEGYPPPVKSSYMLGNRLEGWSIFFHFLLSMTKFENKKGYDEWSSK